MIMHDPTSEPWADSHFRCTKCGKIKITRRKGYPTKYRDYGLCKNCSGYPWWIIHGVEFKSSLLRMLCGKGDKK